MKIYCCSDIHVDHYCNPDDLPIKYENYIKWFLVPADMLLISGDISDDKTTFINFMRIAAKEYSYVIYVLGNHDLNVRKNSFYAPVAKYSSTSLIKINEIKNSLMENDNIIWLNGNVINISDISIGGTMGMCDFDYAESVLHVGKEKALHEWLHWYDNKVWNYMHNDPLAILKSEQDKLDSIIDQKPKIIMTHFSPLESTVNPKYFDYVSTSFFYFNGKQYLDKLENDCIWICGHAHDAKKVEYINEAGNKITIMRNPIAYPDENPYADSSLLQKDFLVDL